MLSTQNDIEAELSYAYLHAVAAKAGMACTCSMRLMDKAGIDATIHAVDNFGAGSILTDISLHVQLKATSQQPHENLGKLSYFMNDVARYDKLRSSGLLPPRILVVLFLPTNADEWFSQSEDELSLKRCAYWTSLRGAAETDNKSGITVYLPKNQTFSPTGLRQLMERISREEDILYAD